MRKLLKRDSGYFCGKRQRALSLGDIVSHGCLARQGQNPCEKMLHVEGVPDSTGLLEQVSVWKRRPCVL
jgi:hypothetical protein